MNYYKTLQINPKATQNEIKQAYRRLAKRFHPDSSGEINDQDKIVQLNAAYEVLGDPQRRSLYDRELSSGYSQESYHHRQQRTANVQTQYQRHRQSEQNADLHKLEWLKEVYTPIERLTSRILNPLETEIENLSADPFDDELMSDFQDYLQECSNYFQQAQNILASRPNPASLAGIAASLYYCLDRISDGIKELEWFTYNYDDRYLHTGKELFRIARSLRREAQGFSKFVDF